MTARPGVVAAYAASVSALVAVVTVMVAQTEVLTGQVEQGFGQHPDIEIYRSQPGLGVILGARVLAEFGDDSQRYADAKARKKYSGMSPITRASGTKRGRAGPPRPEPATRRRPLPIGVLCPDQLPGARAFYDHHLTADPPTAEPSEPSGTDSSAFFTATYATTPPSAKKCPGQPSTTTTSKPLDTLRPWDV